MSQTDEKFQIQIDESTSISRNDMVEHIDHGPMHVERISVGASYKTAQLQSELDATGLKLSGDELREQWGETIHVDPMKIHEENPRVEFEGIGIEELGADADLKVSGDDMDDVETVAMYAQDRIVRAMQALQQGEHPEEVGGIGVDFHWNRILGEEDDE